MKLTEWQCEAMKGKNAFYAALICTQWSFTLFKTIAKSKSHSHTQNKKEKHMETKRWTNKRETTKREN